jgi:hypothetical protein
MVYNSKPVNDSSPSIDDSHTTLNRMPKITFQQTLSFGSFPFPLSSLVPDTSDNVLMKVATSTLYFLLSLETLYI